MFGSDESFNRTMPLPTSKGARNEEINPQDEENRRNNHDNKINAIIEERNNILKKVIEYEGVIIDLRRRNGDLPSTNIAMGTYEFGEVNLSIIEEHWSTMYINLHKVLVQALKNQGQSNSQAVCKYHSLVHGVPERDTITPRLQAYPIVQDVSCIIMNICRSAMLKTNGFVELENYDLVGQLAHEIGNKSLSRKEFAKELLQRLVPPEKLTPEPATSFFSNLPEPMKNILDYKFKKIEEYSREYSIESNVMSSNLEKFLYAAIYVTIEMSVIGDNDIVAFWSSADENRFRIDIPESSDRMGDERNLAFVPHDETIYLDLETVPGFRGQPNGSSPFILFTVFPGCAHISWDGQYRVISKCRVVCGM
ncbi:hypothetical protein BC938DRAFT_475928 [Jimgerdemannia flammicorona]|uniref:Uncharacterized protein n=1 Tax=Jimgerdemannia flammicorona TaxID=994334 RepID=A0A433QR48_9FUNG|nr:hypothetical protein BC938DRAFT_475928 [Jimgerdemannia flammicorona]